MDPRLAKGSAGRSHSDRAAGRGHGKADARDPALLRRKQSKRIGFLWKAARSISEVFHEHPHRPGARNSAAHDGQAGIAAILGRRCIVRLSWVCFDDSFLAAGLRVTSCSRRITRITANGPADVGQRFRRRRGGGLSHSLFPRNGEEFPSLRNISQAHQDASGTDRLLLPAR